LCGCSRRLYKNPSTSSQDYSVGNTGGGLLPYNKSGKKCLALDLDETLVHSSFQPVDNASFVISVVIEGMVHNVFVMKRPGKFFFYASFFYHMIDDLTRVLFVYEGVDEFMERLAEHYEVSL
jgi:hypothetical protein